ncbi:general secretion pathway protein K [Pseudomonas duriflava]|uniref:General secretion pathway protein K n=1 Tax=Pseudomonas duriflava TaxID=459528 RepID=A0A562QIW9_9PSED|nr:type II secretion system protein GspK [Pseudomonas duriflava]TWI56679.1 general secretion pathway protein K [Pseudomonas duriflava]
MKPGPYCLRGKQRGVALLITLWALALLSLIMAGVVTAVRLENRQSQYLLQSTRTQLAAEAGLALAIQHMGSLQREQQWVADGRPYHLDFDKIRLTLEIQSELGKVDLNSTSPELLARLALTVGAPANQARQVAAALRARQESNEPTPFRTLEEATQLAGMDSSLFSRIEPYITVWSGYDQPIAAFAAPPVKEAMGLKTLTPLEGADPGQVLTVKSQAELDNGFRSALSVTLLLNPTESSAQPYRVLRWQE